jgi:hypothetical protein
VIAGFGLISFLALRELITLIPSRRADHGTLVGAFFLAVPLQYGLLWAGWYGMYAIFLPVYGLLAISVRIPGLLLLGACREDPGGAGPWDDQVAVEGPAFAACPGTRDPCLPPDDVDCDEIVAESDRLLEILDRHRDDLFAIDGVIATGIGWLCDPDELGFRVGWDQDGACPSVPARVEGVAVELFPTSPPAP